MAKSFPVTTAIRFLRDNKIDFEQFIYDYEEKGGTRQTSIELTVDEHSVIKTLIFMTENGKGIICLQHGDKEVSAKELARTIGCKTLSPAPEAQAFKWTGYKFGGTSPFGTKQSLPVYAEETIFDLQHIYINGGKQGFIIKISPQVLIDLLSAEKVKAAV